ncbi:Sulfotransferase domain-containing protein [Hirschfeldia incana]|nr:Sulfotransferase domain-containing protein [Hirschfeldia incana]
MTSSSVPVYSRDEYLTQETRDLLSSLPSEKGLLPLVSQMYQYEGSWHTQGLVQGIVNCQKHFEASDSDIILATCPKSGTTWLKALLFALIHRKKFPVTSSKHPLLATNPHPLVPYLEGDYCVSPDVNFSQLPSPRLMQTHLSHHSLPVSIKSSSCKIVYCCRNPKDMFVSLWHFGKKLAPEETADYPIEKAVEAFCQGKFIGGPFWDLVLEYWYESRKNPNKVLFVTYEELKKQTEDMVKRMAEFLGCGFAAEEEVSEIVKLCSFESLSKLEVNKQGKLPNGIESNAFFRKGEVGRWTDTLSESLAEVIDRTTEEKFGGSGLKFSC